MTTMLEKMALAMWGEMAGRRDPDIGDYTDGLRAALLAIREPGREVMQAGITAIEDAHESTRDSYESYLVTNAADYARPGWEAMIDAILNEKPETRT